MNKFYLCTFLYFSGCALYMTQPNSGLLDEHAQVVGAPRVQNPIQGVQGHLFSIKGNMALSFTVQTGHSWNGEVVQQGNLEVGTETEIEHIQGSLEMGVVPLSKKIPYVFPYLGVGGGIVYAEYSGIYQNDVYSFGYPMVTAGLEILMPIVPHYRKHRTEFYPHFFIKGGYEWSFRRWFQGPYVSIGYGGGAPPTGVIASLIGVIFIFSKGGHH